MIKHPKLIKIPLFGGTGNVLFQIAYAKTLVLRGYRVKLIDFRAEKCKKLYKLLKWTTHECWLGDIVSNFKISLIEPTFLHKFTFIFAYAYYRISGNSSMFFGMSVGYYQESVLLDKEAIIDVARLLGNHTPIIQRRDVAALHLRGGDFESHQKNNQLIDQVSIINTLCNSAIEIVTNDIQLANKIILKISSKKNVNIISSEKAIDDFLTLATSSVVFMPESTFSFWAVAINNGCKKVYFSKNNKFEGLLSALDHISVHVLTQQAT